jgi:hypothetical protein
VATRRPNPRGRGYGAPDPAPRPGGRYPGSRTDPLALEGLPERFLPECRLRGRQNKKLQYAVLAAAAQHGGAEPDLLDEVAWWQTDDFWQYALYAAIAYIRAAAQRAGATVVQVCQELGQRGVQRPG